METNHQQLKNLISLMSPSAGFARTFIIKTTVTFLLQVLFFLLLLNPNTHCGRGACSALNIYYFKKLH